MIPAASRGPWLEILVRDLQSRVPYQRLWKSFRVEQALDSFDGSVGTVVRSTDGFEH